VRGQLKTRMADLGFQIGTSRRNLCLYDKRHRLYSINFRPLITIQ